ncbi:MAG: hypothetical protein ACYDA4_11415 [Ignavibacteriaceae bacterium]
MSEIGQLAQLLKDRNVDCIGGIIQKLIDADVAPQTTLEVWADCRNGVMGEKMLTDAMHLEAFKLVCLMT